MGPYYFPAGPSNPVFCKGVVQLPVIKTFLEYIAHMRYIRSRILKTAAGQLAESLIGIGDQLIEIVKPCQRGIVLLIIALARVGRMKDLGKVRDQGQDKQNKQDLVFIRSEKL